MSDGSTKTLNIIAFIAIIIAGIGAINWFLAEVLNWNLVSKIFGRGKSTAKKVVYSVIGAAGLLSIIFAFLMITRHGFDYKVSA